MSGVSIALLVFFIIVAFLIVGLVLLQNEEGDSLGGLFFGRIEFGFRLAFRQHTDKSNVYPDNAVLCGYVFSRMAEQNPGRFRFTARCSTAASRNRNRMVEGRDAELQ